MTLTPEAIAVAWCSVQDEWIVRRNKAHADGKQWEVVHDWGGSYIADESQKVLQRFATQEAANHLAVQCERNARGAAVLKRVQNG